ncbi:SDR family NAD(P)-dependent oxidoreductase [Natrinema ejinorense]|uniref:Dehydrogenase n=1 Tax=Natrinema ejinorense TaxID=373386 RepID=A0A2A5QPV3_9EURY|nr:SDR family oxidoreductase [Natrinema ejinorense]PCR88857.1 dehydrogenase [Natrinema ejinorense]
MELDLSGQTALITGAGRGIGEEIALTFAEAGANVVAAARTESEIEETVADVEAHGVEGLAVPTDLRSVEAIETLVETTVREFGGSEILVNNAALNLTNPPEAQSLEEVDAMMDVNLRAVFLLTQRWREQFVASSADRGRVINVSSNSAYFGIPAMTFYGGTNAGVLALTRGFAATMAEEGVTVNSIVPGLTRVDRIEELLEKQERGEIDRIHQLENHPLNRPAEPEEIAYACLFLAYDLADYITGTSILVDGGLELTRSPYTM